ncbi:MAG TPA: hypothetical protein DCX54_03795 [Flavobacteriales bacterium]|nr:hypothetical protein [Flavobacteriales bacterium]
MYQRSRLVRITDEGIEYDIHQAIRNVESVQLLGRTEFFDEDVQRFPEILDKYEIEFNYKKIEPENVTSSDINKPLEERLEQIRQSLSNRTYNKLMDANSQDLYLFKYISTLINTRKPVS